MHYTRFLILAVLVIIIASFNSVIAQEEEKPDPYVYVTEYQVPWNRVDSLQSILKASEYKWVEKAIEMGFVLDIQLLIHDTGNEWNVRQEWYYPSWEAMGASGWGKKVWDAVEPDEEKQKAEQAKWNWVFRDVIHRDFIWRLASSAR